MKADSLRRGYFLEAAVALTVARLVVHLLPSKWVFAWAGQPPRRTRRFGRDQVEWISWAVETAGASPWIKALCLPRALAAQAMLRRRGIASRLCLGVLRQNTSLVAHAWIEIGEEMIVGGAGASGFTKIAEYGRETS
jgi:hypothetical protein